MEKGGKGMAGKPASPCPAVGGHGGIGGFRLRLPVYDGICRP